MERLPIRWRLTLWYAALLALALIVFGAGLYAILRFRLYQNFDEQLLHQATVTRSSVRMMDDTPTLPSMVSTDSDDDYVLRLLDENGRVVDGSGQQSEAVALDARVVAAALTGRTQYSSTAIGEGETLRIVTVPIRDRGIIVGVLQLGLNRDDTDEVLAELLGVLALAGPVVLLMAVGGGYMLAKRALRPVATITALAGRIDGRDLNARLNLDLPNDELGRLACTFDGMLARIEDAFELQRRFTSDAAHELRTPLSLMRSQVDVALAQSRSATEYRDALFGVNGDLERVTALVSRLLMVARGDSGRMVLDRSEVEFVVTIAHVLDQYASMAEALSVMLRNESSPVLFNGDEDLLVQVLVNLIDNALRHTPTGGTVSVGCAEEKGAVRLWVVDTGTGISPEHQRHVFDRFYPVDCRSARRRDLTCE